MATVAAGAPEGSTRHTSRAWRPSSCGMRRRGGIASMVAPLSRSARSRVVPMKATTIYAARDVRLENQPDPTILKPTDAIVRVVAACVCGSDLWYYRGDNPIKDPFRIGHEFVGVVQDIGAEVRSLHKGDFVIAPFMYSDNTCPHCRIGIQSACSAGGFWGGPDRDGLMTDGGQGEYVRVPLADGTLVATRETPDTAMVPSLLALSDVMGTGWHAATAAGVQEGDTVVVVGDGAVGLSGVLAASRMGAERVVTMSRHEERQQIARSFGATDVIAERGEAGEAAVLELTGGVGAAGGVAPVRQYLPVLRDDVLSGTITPGLVFDLDLPLDKVAEGYAAMDERRAIKTILRP